MSEPHVSSVCCEMRRAIIDAVGRLINRYGYKKMTVEDIAREAGIGKGTVYLYFPSKAEMVLSWFDDIHERLIKELWSIAGSEDHPEKKLRDMLLQRVMFRFDSAQGFAESLDDIFAAIRSSLLARRGCYYKEEAEVFTYALEEGVKIGCFRVANLKNAAYSLIYATNWLLPYSLSVSQLGRRDDIESRVLNIADLMLNGLLKRTAE